MVDYLYGITWLTPLVFTIATALITSVLSQLSFALLTDKNFIKNGRAEMKTKQKELLKLKPEHPDYMKKQNDLLDLNMQLMTHSMKPTLFTMLPFLLLFMYVKSIVPSDQPLISLPFSLPIIGTSLEFIGTYIISSFIFTTIIRKVMRR